MPTYDSTLPGSERTRVRSVLSLLLIAAGFGGGFAIAVFYNIALRPEPFDSSLQAPRLARSQAVEPEPARFYSRPGQYAGTDGRGGEALDTPQARAVARAARAERIRIDNVMRICTGC